MKYLLYFIFSVQPFMAHTVQSQSVDSLSNSLGLPFMISDSKANVHDTTPAVNEDQPSVLMGICIEMPKKKVWFMDKRLPVKYVDSKYIVYMNARKTEDFKLFFSAPVRENETAVYVDGVRLIQP